MKGQFPRWIQEPAGNWADIAQGRAQMATPPRTTVDLFGNCWVGNRHTGTVVKIGLLENGQYMDRNWNGIIETSRDLDGDGKISDDEILPWASDECVIYEVVLIPEAEGTYIPGQYQGAYASDSWSLGREELLWTIQQYLGRLFRQYEVLLYTWFGWANIKDY